MDEATARQPNTADDFVSASQRFWEKRIDAPLTREDAREAIRNASALFDLLAEWDRQATTREEKAPSEAPHD